MIEFNFPVGSASLTLKANNPSHLADLFKAVGGDDSYLLDEIEKAAKGPFELVELKAVVHAQTAPPQEAAGSDPWGDAGGSSTALPSEAAPDPWADDATPTTPAASQSASGGVRKHVDTYGREFTVGLDTAPDCKCGEPAARMKAKSQKTGKPYMQWKCAKMVGDNWDEKCDYSEFVNSK